MTTISPISCRSFASLVGMLAFALVVLAAPSAAQDAKKDEQKTEEQKKDEPKKEEAKKDDQKKDDLKKDDAAKKGKKGKKGDAPGKDEPPPQEEPKDERFYPKADAALEITGHTDWVNQVRYSADGKSLVTVSRDKTVRIWDAASGKETFQIKDLAGNCLTLAVSPDGSKLLTTAGKWAKEKQEWIGEVDTYDAKTGKLLGEFKGHLQPIEAVAYNVQGTQVASGSNDSTAKIWDVATGKELFTLTGHAGPVVALAFSGDGQLLAAGGEDKTVKLWGTSDGKEVRTLTGPKRRVTSVAFSPDGKLLAAGSYDGTVTVWQVADGKEAHVLKTGDGVLTVSFSADGSKLAAGGWGNAVQLWETASGKELGGLAGHSQPITSVVFNAGGNHVVSASLDRTVRVWNVNSATQKVDPPKKEETKKDESKK